MRYIGYSLLAIILLLGIVIFTINWSGSAPVVAALDDADYRRVNAYDLPEQSSVKLGFSPTATTTKLLLYAIVSETQNEEKPNFRFSIEYRFDQSEDFQTIDLSTQLTCLLYTSPSPRD